MTRNWREVEVPPKWECELWEQVLRTLDEAGKTGTSYYLMAEEAVFLCRLGGWRKGLGAYRDWGSSDG